MPRFFVYVLGSRRLALYIGVTNDIRRRVREHRNKLNDGFTSKYNVVRLLHVEVFDTPGEAIAREKQLKGWRRERKIELILKHNPGLIDLAAGWV
jgi:putative endonuclease